MWFDLIIKLPLLVIATWLLIRQVIKTLFGISAAYINPFTFRIIGFEYKDILKIELLEFNPFRKRIRISKLTFNNKQIENKNQTNASNHKKTSHGHNLKAVLPKWLFKYLPHLLSFLNEVHIVADHVFLTDYDLYISTIGSVFNYKEITSSLSLELFMRQVKNKNSTILTDTLQQLEINFEKIEVDHSIVFNDIKIDSKFGVLRLPYAYLKQQSASTKIIEPDNIESKHSDILCDLAIQDTIKAFRKKLERIQGYLKPICEINLYMDKILLDDLELTNLPELNEISQYFTYNIEASNVTLNLIRFSKDYPGYNLNFGEDDTPYKINSNFSRVNIGVKINKINEKEIYLAKIIEVPSINLYGHTNIFSQQFQFSEGRFENALSTLNFQISSLIVDLDITTLSFIKSFSRNIKVFKGAFGYSKEIDAIDQLKEFEDLRSLKWRKVLKTYLTSLFPLLNLKFTLDDSKIILNDETDTIIFYLSALLGTYKSNRSLSFSQNDKLDSIINYDTAFDLELSDLHCQHLITDGSNYNHKILEIESVSLKQKVKWSPEIQFSFDGEVDNVNIDLSELRSMIALNKIVKKTDCQLLQVETIYFKELYDKFAKQLYNAEFNCSRLKEMQSIKKVSPESFVFNTLPDYFDYIKVDLRRIQMTLGIRSVFMPPDIFSLLEAQSPKDLVEGKLRKFTNKVDKVQLALFSNKTQWHNKIEMGQVYMSKSGLDSLNRNDSNDLEDIGTSQSTQIDRLWNFNILVNNVTSSVIYETCKFSTEFSSRTVSSLKVVSIKVFPETESYTVPSENKVVIVIDNKKASSMVDLINVFMGISGFHTLNQIFRKNTYCSVKETCAKKILVSLNKAKKKSFWYFIDWVKFKQLIQIRLSSELSRQVLILPNALKIKFESSNMFISIDKLNDICINGELARMCVESPTQKDTWIRMMLINKFKMNINLSEMLRQIKNNETGNSEVLPGVTLAYESSHFSIPNKFAMYRIFDNISTIVKSLKQMIYSMKTSQSDIVIFPVTVNPVRLPNVNLSSKRSIITIEDDPLESELNMIFQIGLEEQRIRLEKVKQFKNSLERKYQDTNSSANQSEKNNDKFSSDDTYTKLVFLSSARGCKKSKNILKKLLSAKKSDRETSEKEDELLEDKNPILINEHESYIRLQENISTSWIRRIKDYKKVEKEKYEENFEYLWGLTNLHNISKDFNTNVRDFIYSPPLTTIIVEGIDINISQPSCGLECIAEFIHDVGKGVPLDTQYSIMFPMYLDVNIREFRWHLRDYPLPFINIPPPTENQKISNNFKISGDLCLTEAMIQSSNEIRTIFVPLVPSVELVNKDHYYSLFVPRTLTSVKVYSKLEIGIHTERSTQVVWGSSYSPAIQQVMQCFEDLSKPPTDLSPKLGVWDKIRYMFHSRIKINWAKKNRFEISLLGAKSPYKIGREDAGFIIGFNGNTVLDCNPNNSPKQLLACSADQIYFSIPNYFAKPLLVWSMPSHKNIFVPNQDNTNLQTYASYYYLLQQDYNNERKEAVKLMQKHYIEKNGIKLSGGMTLKLGFVFEGLGKGGIRSSDFAPHYETFLCNPIYVKDLSKYDAYKNFKSHFIHMSFALLSNSSNAYNAMQLDSSGMDTFLKWWKSFSNNPPVRRGTLYDAKNLSPKFGGALRTISYYANVSPLFITHIQRNIDINNTQSSSFYENIEYVGIKAKVSRFVMDLHQRKEVISEFREKLNEHKRVSRMKFLEGDFSSGTIDIRTIHAKFHKVTFIEDKQNYEFDLYEDDDNWVDISDFKEPFSISIDDYTPHVTIRPLLLAPQFVYQKRAKYGDKYQLDPVTSEPIQAFKNDISHCCCVNGQIDLPTTYQEKRISTLLTKEKELNEKLKIANTSEEKSYLLKHINMTKQIIQQLEYFIEDTKMVVNSKGNVKPEDLHFQVIDKETEASKKLYENRYLIFGMFLRWDEGARDVITTYLMYLNLNSYFSKIDRYKSIRTFEDIVNQKSGTVGSPSNYNSEQNFKTSILESSTQSAKNHGTKQEKEEDILKYFEIGLRKLITSINYTTSEDHFVQFLAPQIQLSSKFEPNSCIVIAAPLIKLRVLSFASANNNDVFIQDTFLKRYGILISKANVFLFHKDKFKDSMDIFFQCLAYGQTKEVPWSPWLGAESCFDPSALSDSTIIKNLNTTIYLDSIYEFSSVYEFVRHQLQDCMNIYIPKVQVTCDSRSYLTLFKISTNLFMSMKLTDPVLKKKIDKVSISFDFTELRKIYDTTVLLSNVIHKSQLAENESIFRQKLLDDAGLVDLFNIHNERITNLSKLYILLHVLCSRRKERHEFTKSMEWNIDVESIELLMLQKDSTPFLTVVSKDIKFNRVASSSGYNSNTITVKAADIFNLEDTAAYKNLLGPYVTQKKLLRKSITEENKPMFHINWVMDKPIGGIKVVKSVETFVQGLSVSIEEETVLKLVHWLLPHEVASALHTNDESDEESDVESLNSEFYFNGEDNSELNEMIQRSTDFVIMENIVINGFKLCISFKGKGSKRLINVTDFVFNFPKLSFVNQTMRSIDIIIILKKVLIKALLKQSGKFLLSKLKRRPALESSSLLLPHSVPLSKTLSANSKVSEGEQLKQSEIQIPI
ncbi:hypothetical protein TPHA_0I03120 [Tetrapisispora phaffii CBS 4417]|uniref:Uncharacterized protein n=1 Tax=Tetrapisispora phaffii (strain ATCC 24235 / CBS 4417 / NBRC 1672 / NRRL Y-8282 / UCD 70-5) TaxID=1071381 RepID=G8BY35_TETPH|nr:hypothetical protein TPHA_0I03120 [Tetrapisispora phaffii CBS 4417]CCE64813.1 hypothetical protein TPHA_0I03120 [Tetrapisispora phaffii CBS 4417]